jgi:hypothetical protein
MRRKILGSPVIAPDVEARPLPRPLGEAPVLHVGTTLSTASGVVVATGGAPARASRAASCLVAPEPGDTVLLCTTGADTFVVAVLARAAPGALVVTPADTDGLVVAAGRLRLSAERELAVTTPSLALHARAIRAVADVATLLGRLMTVAGRRLRVTVDAQETAAGTQSSKVGTRIAIVDGPDVREAAAVSERIAGTWTNHAAATVLTASTDIHLDARRVSVG